LPPDETEVRSSDKPFSVYNHQKRSNESMKVIQRTITKPLNYINQTETDKGKAKDEEPPKEDIDKPQKDIKVLTKKKETKVKEDHRRKQQRSSSNIDTFGINKQEPDDSIYPRPSPVEMISFRHRSKRILSASAPRIVNPSKDKKRKKYLFIPRQIQKHLP